MKLSLKLSRFLPIVIFYFLVIYFGDAANQFSREYEEAAVSYILDGYNLENIGNYNERIFQKIYVDVNQTNMQTIIIGSSRSMQIGSEIIYDERFFNHSVSGATLEDYLAIINMYDSKELPNRVIIGVDPWIFNVNNSQERWQSINSDYSEISSKLNLNNNSFNYLNFNFTNLFSINYFQNSLDKLVNDYDNSSDKVEFIPTTKEDSFNSIKYVDGSLKYPKDILEITEQQLDEYINQYISGDIYSMKRYESMNQYYMSAFEVLLDYLSSNNVEIVIFLPPYELRVYEFMASNDEYKIIIDIENYLIELAQSKEIRLIGSYNPYKIITDNNFENKFYDAMHPTREYVIEIFSSELND